MAPSSRHGGTAVVMGNCGVGFAPPWPDRHHRLIGPAEGGEDMPGRLVRGPQPEPAPAMAAEQAALPTDQPAGARGRNMGVVAAAAFI